ncbi:MAG: glycerol-3-phosphate acyltransferase [Acidimicrobiales bacterium]
MIRPVGSPGDHASPSPGPSRPAEPPHRPALPLQRVGSTSAGRTAGTIGLAFLAGSVPFANLAARRARGVDLREVGGGTVSGTSLYRVAGFGPLAIAGVFEVAKGAVGPLVAGGPRQRPALAALCGGAAVTGHNWSPFLRGAGGRGISPAMGALLVNAPPGAGLLLGGMVLGRWAGETAIGSLCADLALVPMLRRTSGPKAGWAGAAVVVPMLLKRLAGNAPAAEGRRLRTWAARLVLDRDTPARTSEPRSAAA